MLDLPSNRKIINGSLATVAGYGRYLFIFKLILKNVLNVPKLSISLISIKKLTYDLNCFAMFSIFVCFTGAGLREEKLDLLRKVMDFTT